MTRSVRGAMSLTAAVALAVGLVGCGLVPSPDRDTGPVPDSFPEPTDVKNPGLQPPVDDVQPPDLGDPPQGQAEALEWYAEQVRTQLPDLTSDGTFTDVQVRAVYPDTIAYEYHYAQNVDVEEGARHFDGMIDTFQSMSEMVFGEMEAAGITDGPKVRYTYYNADGSLIWSHTFTAS